MRPEVHVSYSSSLACIFKKYLFIYLFILCVCIHVYAQVCVSIDAVMSFFLLVWIFCCILACMVDVVDVCGNIFIHVVVYAHVCKSVRRPEIDTDLLRLYCSPLYY